MMKVFAWSRQKSPIHEDELFFILACPSVDQKWIANEERVSLIEDVLWRAGICHGIGGKSQPVVAKV